MRRPVIHPLLCHAHATDRPIRPCAVLRRRNQNRLITTASRPGILRTVITPAASPGPQSVRTSFDGRLDCPTVPTLCRVVFRLFSTNLGAGGRATRRGL